jgi:hypothetical protein
MNFPVVPARAALAVLGIVTAIIALALPDTTAASVSLLILGGLFALVVARYAPKLELSQRARARMAIAAIAVVSAYTFVPVFFEDLSLVRGDWAPQHVVLKSVVDHLRHFELPTWSHTLSTGDAPLDVYPSLTYVIAAVVAIIGGLDDYLPWVLIGVAVVAHTLIAINAARLVLRLKLPAWLAGVVGVLLVIDAGSVSGGGIIAAIKFGLVHSAVSQMFFSFAAVSIIDAIHRPRLRTSIAIWIWIALTTAAHPVGLLSVGFACLALVAVAVFARDVPRRRPLAAMAHVIIGTALAAVIWLPLGRRIVAYGQHFSDALPDVGHWMVSALSLVSPDSSFAIAIYLGIAGAIAAMFTRRAAPIFVGAMILLILVALVDSAYVWLDIAPSRFVARLGAQRLNTVARPFLFVAAAYAIWLLATAVPRPRSRRRIFVIGIVGCVAFRFGCQTATLYVAQARALSTETIRNAQPLVDWVTKQMTPPPPPDRFARAVVVDMEAWYSHLTATTGFPAFHQGPIPVVLLRERAAELTPEAMRRYNVRWIITDETPWTKNAPGDPSTEQHLGMFKVREIPGWDGQFARVERGGGRAVVTRLDDDEVDVDLRDTTEPALVALGTAYYPRWRASDARGSVPVYAHPATSAGTSFVVAAWVKPGVTRFRADGPLPSDHAGHPLTIAGLLAAIAIIAIWSRKRWRVRVLRRAARLRVRLPAQTRVIAIGVAAVGLVVWAVIDASTPDRSLALGHGARATAVVEIRSGSDWKPCSYRPSTGQYHCVDRAIVYDTTWTVVNDRQGVWPYTTPAIAVYPTKGRSVEVRVRMTRHLAGRYLIGTWINAADVTIDREPTFRTPAQLVRELGDGDHDVVFQTAPTNEPEFFAFVREDTLHDEPALPLAPARPQ